MINAAEGDEFISYTSDNKNRKIVLRGVKIRNYTIYIKYISDQQIMLQYNYVQTSVHFCKTICVLS